MDKLSAGEILSNLVLLLSILGGLLAGIKITMELTTAKTTRYRIEQEEITKREKEKAQETSVGQKALDLLKIDMEAIIKSKNLDGQRLEKLEQIIHQLEFIKDLVQKRIMANMEDKLI